MMIVSAVTIVHFILPAATEIKLRMLCSSRLLLCLLKDTSIICSKAYLAMITFCAITNYIFPNYNFAAKLLQLLPASWIHHET